MSEQKVVYTPEEINDHVAELTDRLVIEHIIGGEDRCKQLAKQIQIVRQLQVAAGMDIPKLKKPRKRKMTNKSSSKS